MILKLLIDKYFFSDRASIVDTYGEIKMFYAYINDKREVIDEWYYTNVFTGEYHRYLKNYSWLNQDELDYLHQGILNLVLFKMFCYIGNKKLPLSKEMNSVNKALSGFCPRSTKTKKLLELTKKTLSTFYVKNINSNDMARIINWTMNNTILSDKPLNKSSIKR